MNLAEKPAIDSIPDRMSRKINGLAAEHILKNGMNITSDELIHFFWKGFLALKDIKEIKEKGDLCQKKE